MRSGDAGRRGRASGLELSPGERALTGLALGALGGAALLLDRELRVIAGTPPAELLLETRLPPGESAPKLLCGRDGERPIAEALAEGRAVHAFVVRPSAEGPDRTIGVRTIPLGGRPGAPDGWLVELEHVVGPGEREGGVAELSGLWTRSAAMKVMFRLVEKVARSDATVLVRGETGTGKELIAVALHERSPRAGGPFRAINCAALAPSLLESELFGHVRGAFTGAVRDNPGHFRLAEGGTLFLDEVGELPLELQAKLLRVLQTHTVIPVGGTDAIPVDVRIVSATHRALRQEVDAGRFRADLMYRLRVVPIYVPPLRERPEDILLIAEKLITAMNARGGRVVKQLGLDAQALLLEHSWPGNVRELQNAIEFAFVVGEGAILRAADLPPELGDSGAVPRASPQAQGVKVNAPPEPTPSPRSERSSREAARISRALERSAGSKGRAAAMLGISRVTLWRRIRALGLEP